MSAALAEPLLPSPAPSRWRQPLLIAATFTTFFVQFVSLALPAPFLASSPTGELLGIRTVGALFGAFPAGTVLAVVIGVPPRLVRTMGSRTTIMCGVCTCALAHVGFGVAPHLHPPKLALSAIMLGFRLLGGAGAALSETGCLSALSAGGFGEDEVVVVAKAGAVPE